MRARKSVWSLHRVGCRSEVEQSVLLGYIGIMSCGSLVKLMPPALLEKAELYHAVAHYVGVWREAGPDGAQGIFHHVVPVLLMQRHYLKRQLIARGDAAAHLYVLLGGTLSALADIEAYTDVKQMQVVTLLHEPVNCHSAVYTPGNKYRYLHRMLRLILLQAPLPHSCRCGR